VIMTPGGGQLPSPGAHYESGESTMETIIRRVLGRPLLALLVLVSLLCSGSTAVAYVATRPAGHQSAFPQSQTMEQHLGVRFSRIAVVGDGGLVQLSFVVLDAEKAVEFEASLRKPPVIVSEDRPGGTSRISVMKQGHNLIAGQTYYLVYQNTRGAIRAGGHATVVAGKVRLAHVPVIG
jgi:hypothetical protein